MKETLFRKFFHSIPSGCTDQGQVRQMEALTGVNVALLTINDMCKAIDKSMELTDIHLVEKRGGKSGLYRNPKE